VAQHPILEVTAAAIGIDELSVFGFRDGIDCQVATRQILFECDVLVRTNLKPPVTGAGLRFRSRQCILLSRFGVQLNREAPSDTLKSACLEFFSGCADDYPVALDDRQAEQPVAYGAANEISLHGVILARISCGACWVHVVGCFVFFLVFPWTAFLPIRIPRRP